LAEGDFLHLPDGTNFGSVESIDAVGRTLDVKKRGAQAEVHPTPVFAHSVVNTTVLADSLSGLAEDVIRRGIGAPGPPKAARELLLRRRLHLRGKPFSPNAAESAVEFATRVAADLEETILAIQGPPSAGKTYTAAQMVCELVRLGKRVGVTAVSHKVIRQDRRVVLRVNCAFCDLKGREQHSMNTKSVLAIVAAALADLSVAWAATAPQTIHGSIDGSTSNIPCGVPFLLFDGAVPPNGFQVQPVGFGMLVINDNGPAAFDYGHQIPTGFLLSSSNTSSGWAIPPFTTGQGYKPMGPVSVLAASCSTGGCI
jgi:hypothetical protein